MIPDCAEALVGRAFVRLVGPIRAAALLHTSALNYDRGMQIREALPDDAEAACSVMRRSIAELCHADHRKDPAILARWVGNKTPQNFRAWIDQEDNSLLVAVEGDVVLGVGSVSNAGRIGLNYVSPDARFQGVSQALLDALERRAAQRGNSKVTLESTETARRFYLSNGYTEIGKPIEAFGTTSYPMSKSL
jgi:GNAT superfamily N-acetyltransferase